MERDILAEVNHPFIVKLHYGEYELLVLFQHVCVGIYWPYTCRMIHSVNSECLAIKHGLRFEVIGSAYVQVIRQKLRLP